MTISMQNRAGSWVPAIPEPFFLGRRKVRCDCGEKFRDRAAYRGHYALEHILMTLAPTLPGRVVSTADVVAAHLEQCKGCAQGGYDGHPTSDTINAVVTSYRNAKADVLRARGGS